MISRALLIGSVQGITLGIIGVWAWEWQFWVIVVPTALVVWMPWAGISYRQQRR